MFTFTGHPVTHIDADSSNSEPLPDVLSSSEYPSRDFLKINVHGLSGPAHASEVRGAVFHLMFFIEFPRYLIRYNCSIKIYNSGQTFIFCFEIKIDFCNYFV